MANLSHLLPEIVFSSKEANASKQISQWVKEGALKKLAPRVYTSRSDEKPELIIRRNLFNIIGHLFPGILLSHRSALEFEPTSTGNIFLTYTHPRKIKLPGVNLMIMVGPGPQAGDNEITKGLFVSRKERAFLENLQESRKPGPDSKTLTLPEIETQLEKLVRMRGEQELNQLRDKSRVAARSLGMTKEFEALNKIIGSLLDTNNAHTLQSPIALARHYGNPFDPERITTFDKLFKVLNQPFQSIPENNLTSRDFKNFAFFEAYFSNYIEGTEFEIEEAKKIIESGKPLPARSEDSHDILATYKIVSNHKGMQVTPENPDELITIMQFRHETMLGSRIEANPGSLKHKNNRAGNTEFVDHTLVRGTIAKGFENYLKLDDPFAKAIYIQFLVSEVHPFLDGNGRIARVMMNAELVAAGQTRIIIPNVFREDYLGAVRKLSRQHDPDPYVRMFLKARQFSAAINGRDMDAMQRQLEQSNAFSNPDEAKLRIIDPGHPQSR